MIWWGFDLMIWWSRDVEWPVLLRHGHSVTLVELDLMFWWSLDLIWWSLDLMSLRSRDWVGP